MPQDDGISPEVQKENTQRLFPQRNSGAGIHSPRREGVEGRSPTRSKRVTGPTAESRTNTITDDDNSISIDRGGNGNGHGNSIVGGKPAATTVDRAVMTKTPSTSSTTTTAAGKYYGNDGDDNTHQQRPKNGLKGDPGAVDDAAPDNSSAGWKLGGGVNNGRRRGRGNKKILPSEGGFDQSAGGGEAVTDPLMPPDQSLSM